MCENVMINWVDRMRYCQQSRCTHLNDIIFRISPYLYVQKRARQSRSNVKMKLIVFFYLNRVVYFKFFLQSQTINSGILQRLQEKFCKKCSETTHDSFLTPAACWPAFLLSLVNLLDLYQKSDNCSSAFLLPTPGYLQFFF